MRENETGETLVASDGRTFTLRYDFNKLCEMEEVGLDLLNGTIDSKKLGSPLFVRQLFFDGCTDESGQPLPDIAAAGALIQDVGLAATVRHIGRALAGAAFSTGGDVNPKKAQTN